MDRYCAFLTLSAELRNLVYKYLAINEQVFKIKKQCRPKNGQHVAARSGLLLSNRLKDGKNSKRDVLMKWTALDYRTYRSHGSYHEISAEEATDDVVDMWVNS